MQHIKDEDLYSVTEEGLTGAYTNAFSFYLKLIKIWV